MSAETAINVVGGGAWGTALANAAAGAGHPVTLWLRDREAAAALQAGRENPRYLPGVPLHPAIRATARPERLAGARATLLVVPAQTVRGVLEALREPLATAGPVILCAKGIERGSDSFMSAVAEQVLPPGTPVAVLSGPSFAADVARGLPTAVTLAAADPGLAAALSAPAVGAEPSAVPHRRRPRRRDRRRRQERAGHRVRDRRRPGAGRERPGGTDRPRLRRADALRPRLRGAARDADGAFGPRRPRAHRLLAAIAQFRLRPAARRRGETRRGRGRQARRGRVHRGGAGRPRARRRGSRCRWRRPSPPSWRAAAGVDDVVAGLLARPLRGETD